MDLKDLNCYIKDLQLESIIPFFVTSITMLTKLFDGFIIHIKASCPDFLKEILYHLLQCMMVIVTKILFVGCKKWLCEGREAYEC